MRPCFAACPRLRRIFKSHVGKFRVAIRFDSFLFDRWVVHSSHNIRKILGRGYSVFRPERLWTNSSFQDGPGNHGQA